MTRWSHKRKGIVGLAAEDSIHRGAGGAGGFARDFIGLGADHGVHIEKSDFAMTETSKVFDHLALVTAQQVLIGGGPGRDVLDYTPEPFVAFKRGEDHPQTVAVLGMSSGFMLFVDVVVNQGRLHSAQL